MLKTQTNEQPGGTAVPAANVLGIPSQVVDQRPDLLIHPMADRVLAASDFPPIIEMPVPPGWDGVDRRNPLAKSVPSELDRRAKSITPNTKP